MLYRFKHTYIRSTFCKLPDILYMVRTIGVPWSEGLSVLHLRISGLRVRVCKRKAKLLKGQGPKGLSGRWLAGITTTPWHGCSIPDTCGGFIIVNFKYKPEPSGIGLGFLASNRWHGESRGFAPDRV